MNVYAKQKQTHRYRKQTCGYQRKERSREEQVRGVRLQIQTIIYKVDKQQGYTV